MGSTSQARAVKNYRKRLSRRGMARFDVLGLATDRALVREFAKRLAEGGAEAAEIRASVQQKLVSEPRQKGGVLAALRRWPVADLNLTRPYTEGREIPL